MPTESEDRTLSIFHPQLIADKYHGALFFAMYATILKNSDSEHEQLYIYRSFEEGIQFMPESFPVTYDVLFFILINFFIYFLSLIIYLLIFNLLILFLILFKILKIILLKIILLTK